MLNCKEESISADTHSWQQTCLIHLAAWQAWSLLLHNFGFCFLVFGFFILFFVFFFSSFFKKGEKNEASPDLSAAAISWRFFVWDWSVLLDRSALVIVRCFSAQKWLQRRCDIRADVPQCTSNNLATSNGFLLQSSSATNDLEPVDSLTVSYFSERSVATHAV